MKRVLVLTVVIFFVTFSFGQQGFGFGAGFSTSKAPLINFKYFFGQNAVSLGASYQVFNDALSKKEDSFLPNAVVIGDGDYFYSIDVGYTRMISDNFSISGEISFGKKKFYQNVTDDSFSQGGYHVIYKTESKIGAGVFATYYFNETFGIFAGYNSLRQASIGIDVRFVK